MLAVSDGYIYACGEDSNGGYWYWKNGVRKTLNGTSDCKTTVCIFITAYQGSVYLSGYCVNNSNISTPGYWKNGNWNALSSPYDVDGGVGAGAFSIVKTDSAVYVRGMYKNTSGVIKSGFWKDGEWYSLSNPYGSSYDAYADGRFWSSDSSSSDESSDKAVSVSDKNVFISPLRTGER